MLRYIRAKLVFRKIVFSVFGIVIVLQDVSCITISMLLHLQLGLYVVPAYYC